MLPKNRNVGFQDHIVLSTWHVEDIDAIGSHLIPLQSIIAGVDYLLLRHNGRYSAWIDTWLIFSRGAVVDVAHLCCPEVSVLLQDVPDSPDTISRCLAAQPI